jgi:hypothetical protein
MEAGGCNNAVPVGGAGEAIPAIVGRLFCFFFENFELGMAEMNFELRKMGHWNIETINPTCVV